MQQVLLNDREDEITWICTSNGCYSAKLAYNIQFITRIAMPQLGLVWKLKAEPKTRFFIWTLLENRLWTADRLANQGGPHNDSCSTCDQLPESAHHLLLGCPFAKEIWESFASLQFETTAAALSATSIQSWWMATTRCKIKRDNLHAPTVAAYIAWNIWNEQNRRVFQHKMVTVPGVHVMIRDEISLFIGAWEFQVFSFWARLLHSDLALFLSLPPAVFPA